jgi:hypothetical protein
MAEKFDLKSKQCGFESHRGHQDCEVSVWAPVSFFENLEHILRPLDDWCGQNGMPFTSRPADVNIDTGRIQIIYAFEDPGDAMLFALRWQDNDWGLLWHPV